MEALSFMKFWLSNSTGKPRREIRISDSAAVETPTAFVDEEESEEFCEGEGDDSFIELEISLSDFSLKTPQEKKQSFSVSKSKILPFVETGPKLRAFSFTKSKTVEFEKKKENNRSSSLNVRFRIEDYETKTTSFRKTAGSVKSLMKNDTVFFDDSVSSSPVSSSSSSKRFFSLIKPLYTKKQSVNNSVFTSPASSPKQRGNVLRRQLGKSRSASAVVVGGMSSPAKRVDESFQVQQDGIQSAILHCKKSFHSSRESSLLSRSTSESSSSQEKLSTSSSEDSYLFSRIGSDSMSERSIDSLTSIKEEREKISDMSEFEISI